MVTTVTTRARSCRSFARALFALFALSAPRAVLAQEPAKPGTKEPSAEAAAAPAKDSEKEPEAAPAAKAPAAAAAAAPAPAPFEAGRPRLHHSPLTTVPAREPLIVTATIEHPELVKRALLIYATEAEPQRHELEFRRGMTAYVAEVPAAELLPRWFGYAIELELMDGTRQPVFASRAGLHQVSVPEVLMDARERALHQRLGGRRSVFSASGDYVDFGTSQAETLDQAGTAGARSIRDRYFRLEGGYTYRPLRVVTEFSLRLGVVRGTSPVPSADQANDAERDPFAVGLNYGAPSVRFRLNDFWHLEGEFLTSVTEEGFSLGAGAAVLIGDPYGAKLTLGFESIRTFGTRFWSRMDIPASTRFVFSPIIEITDMPHADQFGVRLLGELGLDVGAGFSLAARGGYQARLYTEGGPSAGGTVAYAF